MHQVPIKVYSKADFHALRKAIREESGKWLDTQSEKEFIQSLLHGFERHNTRLSSSEMKTIADLTTQGKKGDYEKVRKETKAFVKSITESLRGIQLDSLPSWMLPGKEVEFDSRLDAERESKVTDVAGGLKKANEAMETGYEYYGMTCTKALEKQLETINEFVKDIVNNSDEATPQLFELSEVQSLHSEMLLEKQLQEIVFKRQQELLAISAEIDSASRHTCS
jgi:hypothetical protein